MRLFGRTLFVALVVCLFLLPSRSQAAPIPLGSFDSGTFGFGGTFDVDNEVALYSFTLDGDAALTINTSSFVCLGPDDPCGFIPIFTLFEGSDVTKNSYLGELNFDDPSITSIDWRLLSAGNYLLAITMWPNYFDFLFTGAFEFQNEPGFATDFEACPEGFLQEPACRSGVFEGTFAFQSVPEPGTLTLLVIGGLAAAVHRRRRTVRKSCDCP